MKGATTLFVTHFVKPLVTHFANTRKSREKTKNTRSGKIKGHFGPELIFNFNSLVKQHLTENNLSQFKTGKVKNICSATIWQTGKINNF